MHDRRIEGQTYTFGNYGALWMNAMTWWDHETESIWTQPWGRALIGPLKGTILRQIPAEIVPWSTWRTEHPRTLALDWDGGPGRFYQQPTDGFVVGVTLADSAVAFPYEVLSAEGVVNAEVGPYPVVVHTNPDDRASHVYLRTLEDGSVLTFGLGEGGTLIDDQTGSTWDPVYGLAVDGPLQGSSLLSVPYSSAYDWAWLDFYPHSTTYAGQGQYR